jgi:hypothetical protein
MFPIIAAAALAAREVSIPGVAPAGVDDDFVVGFDPAEAAGFFSADAAAVAAGFFAGVSFFALEPVSLFFLAMGGLYSSRILLARNVKCVE